jgi:3'(2'), 5'-bisphosphate nucleotidase
MPDDTSSDTRLLEAMITAAIEAGRAVHEIYRAGFEVALKADDSPVCTADHASEAIILRHLARAAPDTPVIAEEQVAAGHVPALRREFFLVDPLDGTKEFIQRRGDFTINIALVRERTPVLGVVYAPANDSLYAGDVGAGHAFRSQQSPAAEAAAPRQPIHIRPAPEGGLTVVASRSHASPETEAYLTQYPVARRVPIGSSLKFCLVAAGEADLYPRLGDTMEWDTAAGQAVLVAAGGKVWGPGGVALSYGKPGFRNPSFIACGALVPQVLAG